MLNQIILEVNSFYYLHMEHCKLHVVGHRHKIGT